MYDTTSPKTMLGKFFTIYAFVIRSIDRLAVLYNKKYMLIVYDSKRK